MRENIMAAKKIDPATGRLGVLTPGMGAVATTFVAGVYAVRQGHGKPIGSLTQMGTIRLGKRTDKRVPLIKDFVSLSDLDDLVFGGWDIFEDDMYAAAVNAGVLERATLDSITGKCETHAGRVRSELCETTQRHKCKKRQDQNGFGRSASQRYPNLQS
jgi:hypothetical protein